MRRPLIGKTVLLGVLGLALGAAAVELRLDEMVRAELGLRQRPVGASPDDESGTLAALMGVSEGADEDGLVLRAPTNPELLVDVPASRSPEAPKGELRAHAYEYTSRVFRRTSSRPRAIGIVRRGTVLHAVGSLKGKGCPDGTWYKLSEGGIVCSSRGFTVSRTPRSTSVRQPRPDVSKALPFRYGRVTSREALRFYRVPSAHEESLIQRAVMDSTAMPEVVSMQLDGDYFIAIDREESSDDRTFYRTLRGRYVRTEQVELKPEPKMRGELLDDEIQLPLAFVYGEDDSVPLFRTTEGGLVPTGSADKHARFQVAERRPRANGEIVLSPAGIGVAAAHLRIANRIERPEGVSAEDKWIHVELSQQTLVAYEGDRPVFATLVSSGREDGYATPQGLFQVAAKHISTTMRGEDPVEGRYEVAEVPWTMYYWNSYALHGAYWHNDFGRTRSHGCTNLSPIDARWLFHWTDHDLPEGWNGIRQLEGTHVYITDHRQQATASKD